jgi:2'-5' RNA ligase
MAMTRPTDRLFVGVRPNCCIAPSIANLAEDLRLRHNLVGRPLLTEHFHVTAMHIGDGFGLPQEAVDAATHVMWQIELRPFRVMFDRVKSFSNGALVLCGSDGVAGLELLHARFCDILAEAGLKRRRSSYTPHITLLRDRHLVAEEPVEPISWTVREIVLVHSLLGRTTHHDLVKLPLLER